VLEEKEMFRAQAASHIELIDAIARDLHAATDHRLPEDAVIQRLEQAFSPVEARRQLDTAIDWGRYAELFAYDDDAGEFSLEDEGQPPAPIA
jgi:NitT/TauT family transport system ATP-binding protein